MVLLGERKIICTSIHQFKPFATENYHDDNKVFTTLVIYHTKIYYLKLLIYRSLEHWTFNALSIGSKPLSCYYTSSLSLTTYR